MNDLNVMEQSLIRVKRLRDDWIMKGYDTPVMTYQEQLDEYNELVERFKQGIEGIKNEIINSPRHSR